MYRLSLRLRLPSAYCLLTTDYSQGRIAMRRVRYSVATSLDGYIAGPAGEFDWIITDPAIDFAALFSEFDTVLMGRKTFEIAEGQGPGGAMPGMRTFVF